MAPALFPSRSLFVSLFLYELLVSYTLFLSLSLPASPSTLSIYLYLSLCFAFCRVGVQRNSLALFAVGGCPYTPALPLFPCSILTPRARRLQPSLSASPSQSTLTGYAARMLSKKHFKSYFMAFNAVLDTEKLCV